MLVQGCFCFLFSLEGERNKSFLSQNVKGFPIDASFRFLLYNAIASICSIAQIDVIIINWKIYSRAI